MNGVRVGKTERILQLLVKENDQLIQVGKNAQLGRASDLSWATKREIPKVFGELELAIQIIAGNRAGSISRNHCAILSDEEGNFNVIDLNSHNGTFLNDQRLQKNAKYPLKLGDIIRLANTASLKISGYLDTLTNNHALLIGYDDKCFEGGKKALDNIIKHLDQRGFRGNIRRAHGEKGTKQEVLGYLEKLNPLTTPDTHLLLYYAGIGQEGLHLGKERISPEELYTSLNNLRGKKAIILDYCEASEFLDEKKYNLPLRTLIIAATAERNTKHYTADSKRVAALGGELTTALIQYFNENPGRINLDDLKEQLREKLPSDGYGVFFRRRGVEGEESFTICTSVNLTRLYNRGILN